MALADWQQCQCSWPLGTGSSTPTVRMARRVEDASIATVHYWRIHRRPQSPAACHADAECGKFHVCQPQESDFRLSAADAGMQRCGLDSHYLVWPSEHGLRPCDSGDHVVSGIRGAVHFPSSRPGTQLSVMALAATKVSCGSVLRTTGLRLGCIRRGLGVATWRVEFRICQLGCRWTRVEGIPHMGFIHSRHHLHGYRWRNTECLNDFR